MSNRWIAAILAMSVTMALLNVVIFVGQLSTSASARTAESKASKLLDDDDFSDGLTKLIRKTVRDYCTVGKRESIDC